MSRSEAWGTPSRIAAGLADRMRSLVLVQDRLDRLESGSGSWRAEFETTELETASKDFTLRGLRTAAAPANFAILARLAQDGSSPLQDLIAATGLGRLGVSERLNDLIQVGFAVRLIDTDHAQITPAGAALVELIEGIAAETADQYRGHSA